MVNNCTDSNYIDTNFLTSMYTQLDCWYLDIIPGLTPKSYKDVYILDRLPFLTQIDNRGSTNAFQTNLVQSMLTVTKLDSIQLLLEPQNAVVGLRPAYMLEVFSKTPRTAEAIHESKSFC